jgi:hypothetical protein
MIEIFHFFHYFFYALIEPDIKIQPYFLLSRISITYGGFVISPPEHPKNQDYFLS